MLGKSLVYFVPIVLLLPYLIIAVTVLTTETLGEEELYEVVPAQYVPIATPGRVIRVAIDGGGDFSSLVEAVRSASPGDTILVLPGVYRETVVVEDKPWISIEGVNTDKVVLDGGFKLGNGIYVKRSPHVKITNLTVKNYLGNGVLYASSDYFELRNVVSLENRVYGLYALASRKGIFSGVVAAGSGDSGLYIGEVFDCECVIENSVAYNNLLGYSGTRSNGVTIRNSIFYNNSVGIGPNTLMPNVPSLLTGRWNLPLFASNHVIEGNIIENNNNRAVKAVGWAATYGVPVGTGIALIGSFGNTIRNNVIRGDEKWGVAEWFFLVPPVGNAYIGNKFENNQMDYWRDGWGFGSCSEAEQARGDVPAACNLHPVFRISIPNPIKHLELLIRVESPGSSLGLAIGGILVFGLVLAGGVKAVTHSGVRRRTRVASGVIDALFAGDVYVILALLLVVFGFGLTDFRSVVDAMLSFTFLLFPLAYFIWAVTWVVYAFVAEASTGRTIGNKLLGLKIVHAGMKPSLQRLLLRNLARYVDILGFGAVGVISLLVSKRTLGDIFSGVTVEKE